MFNCKELLNIYDNPRKLADFYKKIGIDPLPIPPVNGKPSKYPTTTGWTKAAAEGHSLDDFQEGDNIAALLGGEKHASDADFDSDLARRMGPKVFAAAFPRIADQFVFFGRESTGFASHFFFLCDQSLPSIIIKDPLDSRCTHIEYRCLKQDGSRGLQTVLPGSIHPITGERIEFHPDSASTIPTVEAQKLLQAVRLTGAACLVAKHFPVQGDRHTCILALARVFCQGGKKVEFATQFIGLTYSHSAGYNHDLLKVESDIKSVYRTFERSPDTHLFGYPTLCRILSPVVVDRVLELLDIKKPEGDLLYSLDDIGNAERFVHEFKERVRYCLDEGCWYVDDGRRWCKDTAQAIRELAKQIGSQIEAEAYRLTSPVVTGDQERDVKAEREFQARKKLLLKWANFSLEFAISRGCRRGRGCSE
jgi:D5 N terminal like